jgi:outer membrane protein
MKKIIIIAGILSAFVFTNSAIAQTKIAYIDMQQLIQAMPETKSADTALQKFGNELQQQVTAAQQQYQQNLISYQQQSDSLSDAIKEIKTKELSNQQKNLQDLSQTAQDSYTQKQTELLQPILEKAKKIINEVAKEKGYSYVIDNSQNILVAYPTADDLLPAVEAKLGIK